MSSINCQCACGHTQFSVKGPAKLRMICHCTICQKFNGTSFADILVYQSAKVSPPAEGVVVFNTYKAPPNVQRGKCSQCGQAAIEVFNMPLFPKLTMVPAAMMSGSSELPAINGHMFYEKRCSDAKDDSPKHHGFIASQMAFFKYLWFAKKG